MVIYEPNQMLFTVMIYKLRVTNICNKNGVLLLLELQRSKTKAIPDAFALEINLKAHASTQIIQKPVILVLKSLMPRHKDRFIKMHIHFAAVQPA